MRRVLVIGNSHVAALRQAWEGAEGGWPGVAFDFAGAHGDVLMSTQVRGGVLEPVGDEAAAALRTLSTVPRIVPGAYDGIAVAGCRVGVATVLPIWRDMRWAGLPSVAAEPDLAEAAFTLVTRGAAVAAMTEWLSGRLGPALIRHLVPHVRCPIWLTAQPAPAAGPWHRGITGVATCRAALRSGDAEALAAAFGTAATAAVAAAGGMFLAQPAATRDRHILTRRSFMHGAVRLTPVLGRDQPPTDIRHANAAYGALMLDRIAEEVRAAA